MPPMSCAASRIIVAEKERRSCSSELPSANVSAVDPLLERFLQQQFELNSIPTLRPDLMILPRQPAPLSVPMGNIVPLHIPWSPQPIHDPGSLRMYTIIPEANSIRWYADVPNITFADFMWADSAIRRMRIEAMYI